MSTEPSMRYVADYGQYVILADSSAETSDESYRRMGRYFADPAIRKKLGGSRPMFERYGWRVASVRGSWTYYDKEVERVVAV